MMNGVKRVGVVATTTLALIATPLIAVADEGDQADNLVTLDLYNLTDIHGHIAQATHYKTGKVTEAGLGAMNCFITKAREENPDTTQFTLLGDNIGASTFESAIQKDNPTIRALNAMKPLASTVGNHEFDEGVDVFKYRALGGSDEYTKAEFPYLAANMTGKVLNGSLSPYKIWNVEGKDIQVAFVGGLEADAPTKVVPGTFDGITFTNAAEAINKTAKDLKENKGVDIVIAMYDNDTAQSVKRMDPKWVDGLMGGDTHKVYQLDATDTTVAGVASGSYTDNLADLRVVYDQKTHKVSSVKPMIIPAAEIANCKMENNPVQDIVDAAVKYAQAEKEKVAATNIGEFHRGTVEKADDYGSNRGIESTLGDLIANAMRDTIFTDQQKTKPVDIGMINAGGIRADLAPAEGKATRGDIFNVLPFGNEIGYVELKGKDVKQLLEEQWKEINKTSTRPMLKLGLSDNVQYTYDPTRKFGDRVTSVLVNGEKLDPEKVYTVGSVTFLLEGGDTFDAFKNAEKVISVPGSLDRDAFEQYLVAKGKKAKVEASGKKQSVGVSMKAEQASGSTKLTVDLRGLSFSEGPGIAKNVKVTVGKTEATAEVNNDLKDKNFNTMDAIITTDGAGQAKVSMDVTADCSKTTEPKVTLPLTVATSTDGKKFQTVVDQKQGLTVDVNCGVAKTKVYRDGGNNRYQTAIEIAKKLSPSDTLYLATGTTYPDALTAAAAAGHKDAPVLLVEPNVLHQDVAGAIKAVQPKNIVIVGGEGAISTSVESKVADLDKNAKVTRVAGENRFVTAAKLATSTYPKGADTVYVANGLNFPDALSASAAGAYKNGPVVLTMTRNMPTETSDAIKALKPKNIVFVGGQGVISKSVVDSSKSLVEGAATKVYPGDNRFQTAAAVATGEFEGTVPFVAVADGMKFPDALTSAAVAGSKGGPVLLTQTNTLNRETKDTLVKLAPTQVMVAGGPAAVSQTVMDTIAKTVKAD